MDGLARSRAILPVANVAWVGPGNCRVRDASIKLLLTKCAHPVQVWRVESSAGLFPIPWPVAWMSATGDRVVRRTIRPAILEENP